MAMETANLFSGIATASFILAFICLGVSVFLFFRLRVADAVRFLRHKKVLGTDASPKGARRPNMLRAKGNKASGVRGGLVRAGAGRVMADAGKGYGFAGAARGAAASAPNATGAAEAPFAPAYETATQQADMPTTPIDFPTKVIDFPTRQAEAKTVLVSCDSVEKRAEAAVYRSVEASGKTEKLDEGVNERADETVLLAAR